MATWAIGDLQGCLDPLQRLLDTLRFDPAADRLWFCGDLVNRGGQSLETLRLVHSLRASSVAVLGNHDLSLLAIGARSADEQRRVNPDLQRVLFAEDGPELLEWLRMQPLLHAMAERHAREVEAKLHGDGYRKLLRNMYGDKPAWSPRLSGPDRDRAIINVFTRLRYCSPKGRIAFDEKGPPGTQQPGLYPWYAVPGRAERELRIVCGHWSALGLFVGQGVHAIDTGAVWGGKLTALRLDGDELRVVQVAGRDVPATPPQARRPQRRPARPQPGKRPPGASAAAPKPTAS